MNDSRLADKWSSRSLRNWLGHALRELKARGSSIVVVHQHSHLSLRGGDGGDHRLLLHEVDVAAGKAYGNAEHAVNLSGWNHGCADWELFDEQPAVRDDD